MARAYGLDSHTEGGMLDHKIRSPSSLPYHLDFMVGFDRGASSMVQQKHFTKFSVNFTQIYYISNKTVLQGVEGGSPQNSTGGVGGVETPRLGPFRRRGGGGAGSGRLRRRTRASFGQGRWWCAPRAGA
jgi:hypothetical protein